MRNIFLSTCFVSTFFLSSCTTYPIPETVLKDTTVNIVHKIRCEAREVLEFEVIKLLTNPKYSDDTSRKLAYELREGLKSFDVADKELRSKKIILNYITRKKIEELRHAGLAFDFKFTITENKNLTGEADLGLPFTGGALSFMVNSGVKKARKNVREIQLADTFSELLVNEQMFCEQFTPNDPNPIYPIAGRIGIEKSIVTFNHLVGTTDNVKVFSDEITFTTTLNAQLNPTVTLSKVVPKQLRLVSAGIDANADRMDEHYLKLLFTDKRKADPVSKFKNIQLGDGVHLKIPLPAKPRKKGTQFSGGPEGFFSISKEEAKRIKKDALRELDRQEFLNKSRELDDLLE